MHTERTRDKLTMTPKEVQEVMRKHIETQSGRKISGEVCFRTIEMMAGIFETVAYAHLQFPEGEEDDE